MSGTSKLWMALLTVVVWGFAATAAHAQGTTTIKAGDTAWQPNAVTVPTGTTVRWEFDQTTVAAHGHVDQRQLEQERVARARRRRGRPHTFNRAGHLHVPLQHPRRHDRHGHRRVRRPLRRARLLPHHRLPPRDRHRRRPHRHPADGDGRGLQRPAQRGPDALHRRRACARSRSSSSSTPTARASSTAPSATPSSAGRSAAAAS